MLQEDTIVQRILEFTNVVCRVGEDWLNILDMVKRRREYNEYKLKLMNITFIFFSEESGTRKYFFCEKLFGRKAQRTLYEISKIVEYPPPVTFTKNAHAVQ